MKKQIVSIVFLLFAATSLFSQVNEGDINLIQKHFGVQKIALLKEYMEFTPEQDAAFWPVFNTYETERQALAQQRILLVDEYMKAIENVSPEKATELVSKGADLEIKFKKLQKKYFKELSKKVGPVKASQFYQFENYLNNLTNLLIQQSIPFVGELQQKYPIEMKK